MKKNIVAFILALIVSFASISAAFAQTANDSAQTNDKKLKIIKKPISKTDGKCSQSSGLAVVRVTFDKSGSISEVEMVKLSDCSNFDKNSLEAARQIKFEAEVKTENL